MTKHEIGTIAIGAIVLALVLSFLVAIGKTADRTKEIGRLQSKCVVEMGRDAAWCWHWANAQEDR